MSTKRILLDLEFIGLFRILLCIIDYRKLAKSFINKGVKEQYFLGWGGQLSNCTPLLEFADVMLPPDKIFICGRMD